MRRGVGIERVEGLFKRGVQIQRSKVGREWCAGRVKQHHTMPGDSLLSPIARPLPTQPNPIQATPRRRRVLAALQPRAELAAREEQVDVVRADEVLREADDRLLQRRLAVVVRAVLGDVAGELRDLFGLFGVGVGFVWG